MPADDPPTDSPELVGHVHLKIRQLDRSIAFYTSVFGLSVTERHDNYAFLSFGDRHHDVALQAIGEDASSPAPGVGLYHAAFEVDTPVRLAEIYDRLQDRGVQVSPVDHRISKALYFDDPDGNGLELYMDTREANNCSEWDGENEQFDPHAYANR